MTVNFVLNGETSGAMADWKLGAFFTRRRCRLGLRISCFLINGIIVTLKRSILIEQPIAELPPMAKEYGSNDGQFHAFRTGEPGAGGGAEIWSFIPPNFLPKLKLIAHSRAAHSPHPPIFCRTAP